VTTIGLIGCGRIGQRHLAAYTTITGCNVVICDVNGEVAASVSQAFGVPRVKAPTCLFSDPSIDAIDVCTPTATHCQLVVAALEAHKHVFCEKPLCTSLTEVDQIAAAQHGAGRLVMVGYLYRFSYVCGFVRSVLREGVIGTPHFAILRFGGRGSQAAWKHRRSESGGASSEMLVHALDLATWLFDGEIATLRSLWSSLILPRRSIGGAEIIADADDCTLLQGSINGVTVMWQADMVTPAFMQYLDIQGSDGSIFTSVLPDMPTRIYCREARHGMQAGLNLFTFPSSDFVAAELNHFVSLVRGGPVGEIHSVSDSASMLRVLAGLS